MRKFANFAWAIACVLLVTFAQVIAHSSASAETIKIGLLKTSNAGPVLIAREKGYFNKEGLSAEFFFADQPQLLPQGIMAGDLDFALVGPLAGFLNTAAQGAMRIVAGNNIEAPGFVGNVLIVSNQAYASGLKTFDSLGGHSFAITGAGTIQQYALAALAPKHNFAYASIRMMPVGTFPNAVSAVVGGTADSALVPMSTAREVISENKLHSPALVGDEMRLVLAVAITSRKTADEKGDLVQRFLRVYRAGAHDYHDAFIGPDERPHYGPTAPDTYALISKYIGVPIETMKLGVAYLDADGRLDVDDIMHQIAWYQSQGFVKPEVDGSKIIDMRYVVPLPEK